MPPLVLCVCVCVGCVMLEVFGRSPIPHSYANNVDLRDVVSAVASPAHRHITIMVRSGAVSSYMGYSSSKRSPSGGCSYILCFMFLLLVACVRMYSKANVPPDIHQSVMQRQLQTSCTEGPTIAMLMLIIGHSEPARNFQYWTAVANRRAYAAQYNYPLYLVVDELGSGQHAAWEKLVAVSAVFQHSCAEWIWMSDADAYIMNLHLDVGVVAHDPAYHRNPNASCNTVAPDIVAAGSCLAKINTGSILWKNTNWTHQFIADAWHSKFIARPLSWWDQAAVLHLYKLPETQQHVCIVKQRAINALPGGCNDGFGGFEDGDLLVHFPGGMKQEIATSSSKWLQKVPIAPTTGSADVFLISALGTQHDVSHGSRVHVTMETTMYSGQSDMPIEHDVVIVKQQSGLNNAGYPVVLL